jgi:glycosyltransferase involved in cell wall biosynthesis
MCEIIARRYGRSCVLRLGIVRYAWKPFWDWYTYNYLPNGIIANTHRVKRAITLLPWVQSNKVQVIYNGVAPPSTTKPAAMDDDRIEHGLFEICTVGTLSWRKGMEFLIRAIALLPADLKDKVYLTVVGDGPAKARLDRLVTRLDLAGHIRFTGAVADPAPWIAKADLFALLSSNEGISNAMLEAMSIAAPVYVTLVGGHGEVISDRENGYVCKSRSPRRIARDLVSIIDDPNRCNIGRAGLETAQSKFTLDRMGRELEAYLLDMVNKTASSAPILQKK